jgi:hypothetical protein
VLLEGIVTKGEKTLQVEELVGEILIALVPLLTVLVELEIDVFVDDLVQLVGTGVALVEPLTMVAAPSNPPSNPKKERCA